MWVLLAAVKWLCVCVCGLVLVRFGALWLTRLALVCVFAVGDGTRCVIPFRGDDMEWRDLRVMGDYGMVVPLPFSPRDEDSIRATIRNSDVVVNLIGKDYETTHYAPNLINYSFEDTHNTLAATIARISVEEVRRVVEVVVFVSVRR